MAALEAITFATAAGFAFVVVITTIVIIGVRREERRMTFMRGRAPGAVARLARLIVGHHGLGEYDKAADCDYSGDCPGPYKHRTNPRGR